MKPQRPKTPGRKTPSRFASSNKDPIVVYCRIRPLFSSEPVCITRQDDQTVVLSGTNALSKEKSSVHSFSYVFGEETTQKQLFDHVALPLVQDVLQGSNALIFTYGVTSSGKTYTMTGSPEDGGLLPRSLDAIFNSISEYQAEKYVFKPNKFNGFEIQSIEEAYRDRLREPSFVSRTPRPKGREINKWNNRIPDPCSIEEVSSDMRYSVYISYLEIYNNYIYDLLEDISDESLRRRNFPVKNTRQDASNNIYVSDASIIEVKTVDEALELFLKGQARRKVANTALNSESSRSHSIFTIRVVQAPLDDMGQNITEDESKMTISQLSLVDLAGSERARRTNIVSHKNKYEAGNINSSLMTLRSCIEALRNNQKSNGITSVPYRDSKLTYLFSNFFKGEGKIRMVLCVNPREDDYIENTHVLMFAEMTQEVEIARSTPMATPQGRTGRGNLYREAARRAMEHGLTVAEILAPVVYNLPEFPVDLLENSDDEESCENLIQFLDEYMNRKQNYWQDVHRRQADFRSRLTEIDRENANLRNTASLLEKDLKARNKQVCSMEQELAATGDRVNNFEKQLMESKRRLDEKEEIISQLRHENREIRTENHENRAKMQEKLANEKDKMRRIMERRLAEKQAELEGKLCFSGEKFRLLREILNAGEWDDLIEANGPPLSSAGPSTVPSDLSVPQTRSKKRSSVSESSVTEVKIPISSSSNNLAITTKKLRSHRSKGEESRNDFDSLFAKENKPPGSSQRSIAIANLRHRRSQSSSGDVWVEHKPVGNLELSTVLQPKMKKRRSVTKLKVKDVTNKDASKYVLEHQEQDSQGDIETQLYKGDIIPSAGGGAQIVFNDVEKLRQESPPSASGPYNFRKRSSEGLPLREIEDRCTVAVECHGVPSKVMKKK